MNPNVAMTLDEAVDETLGLLTGLDLTYSPEYDRYRAITRQLNRALRATALEREWSYYSDLEHIGVAQYGQRDVPIRATVRPRIIGDDSVRFTNDAGEPVVWAYFLPRDAIEKYPSRRGLWVSVTRQSLHFSRPFNLTEHGKNIMLPVMREPRMFDLPAHPKDDTEPLVEVPTSVREQLLDFDFPDLIVARAAYFVAQTDPVMQPRVQTLENEWKNIFYALNERDERNTDHPFLNEWTVPVQSDVNAGSYQDYHHPHADERF